MFKNPQKGPQGNAPQQPSWLLAAVWAVLAFFLIQQCTHTDKSGPKPDPADLRAQLVADNAQLKEVTAGETYRTYTSALGDQESNLKTIHDKKKIDDTDFQAGLADLNSKRAEATVLYVDALLRGGEKSGRFDRFQDAYQTLYTLQQSQGTKPNWNELQVTLPANSTTGQRTTTPAALWDKVVAELGTANRSNLVWGFIPGYNLINFLVNVTGAVPGFSYWFAALLLAVLVRGVAWPLTQRQLMFSRQMSQLTPLVKEVQEKYKNNEQLKSSKTMELYGEYGINPAAGCLPALIQIPLFFAIYQCMLQYRFDFQKGFFLWINPSVAKMTHGFTAPNLGQPDRVLIIIYAASMLTSTLLTPVSDPTQVRQQRITGVIVSLVFPLLMFSGSYPLPCAFVLYWTFTNLFSTLQSLRAYRMPAPPLIKKQTVAGGIITQAPRKPSFWETLQERAKAQLEEKQLQAEQLDKARKGLDVPDTPAKKATPPKSGGSGGSSNGKASKNGKPDQSQGPKSKPKKRT